MIFLPRKLLGMGGDVRIPVEWVGEGLRKNDLRGLFFGKLNLVAELFQTLEQISLLALWL